MVMAIIGFFFMTTLSRTDHLVTVIFN
jgi:hypothetical protein